MAPCRLSHTLALAALARGMVAPWSEVPVKYGRESYLVNVQPAAASARPAAPPLVLLPPVGVGIDRGFYRELQLAWARLGAPAELHAPDLLGCGSATPKPRRFYTPEVWAEQVDDYIRASVGRPCVLVAQGGLAPAALEIWRRSGRESIAAVSLISPPSFQFFAAADDTDAADADADAAAAATSAAPAARAPNPPRRRASRRAQRVAWLAASTPLGNLFFRRLRGARGARIRRFSERSLFARAAAVDDAWVDACVESARDRRGRFAVFSYLCGTIPRGGCWRDDRGPVARALDVPCQVVSGDFFAARAGVDPTARLREFAAQLPRPSECAVIRGGRSVLPYENAEPTAIMLARFVSELVGSEPPAVPDGVILLDMEVAQSS